MKKIEVAYIVMQEHNDNLFGVYTDQYLAFKKYLKILKKWDWNASFFIQFAPINTEVEIDTMNRHLYSMRYQQYQSIKDLSEEELIESEAYLKYLECIEGTQKHFSEEENS